MQAIEWKKGMIFDEGGKLMLVMAANHHKPGNGNTVMQMDLRDVRAGSVIHKTMRPSEKIELVEVVKKNAQYLYAEGDSYNFMDTETYEQYAISGDQLGDDVKYLMPNIEVILEFTEDGELLAVQLPSTVNMKVVETQPGIKGATAASGGKPATMETGLVVTVPDFINEGDELVINTLEGTYKGRA